MSEELVRVEVAGGIAQVTLNRPERRNAFTDPMWAEFLSALDRVLADDAARVLLIAGAEGNFTAGADVSLVEGKGDGTPSGRPHPFLGVLHHLTTTFDKPIVAAVDGVAVGFGLTFLLHCDFVYVTDRARLRAPFVRLGVVPEAGASYLLSAVLGSRNAAEVLYAADFIGGARAVELGIANACVSAGDLLTRALATARKISEQAPGAVRATKRLLLDARRDQVLAAVERENAAFARRIGTPENLEAIRAFYEKRPPNFSKVAAD